MTRAVVFSYITRIAQTHYLRWDTIDGKDLEHLFPIYRIERFFEIYKRDNSLSFLWLRTSSITLLSSSRCEEVDLPERKPFWFGRRILFRMSRLYTFEAYGRLSLVLDWNYS